MTLARRHRRGPGQPVSGLPPNGGFGRSFEDVSYGPYVKEPSRQVHFVATKSSTGNPGKQTQRPSETSPPRSQFIAPGSLRRICGSQRASDGALFLLSTDQLYTPACISSTGTSSLRPKSQSEHLASIGLTLTSNYLQKRALAMIGHTGI